LEKKTEQGMFRSNYRESFESVTRRLLMLGLPWMLSLWFAILAAITEPGKG